MVAQVGGQAPRELNLEVTPALPPSSAAEQLSGAYGDLCIEEVSFSYGGGRRPVVAAVDQVGFVVPHGALAVLVGPSGCGKSTLLRLAAGLVQPTLGRITFGVLTPDELRKQRRVGFAFQDPALLSWRSVRRNVELPFDLAKLPVNAAWINELLEIVRLSDWADRRPASCRVGCAKESLSPARWPRGPTFSCSTSPSGHSTR